MICVIPARGGSQRIPGKNIKPFRGKPIIKYSIEAAQKTKMFTSVVVATDSQEIKDYVQYTGAMIYDRLPVDGNETMADFLYDYLMAMGIQFRHICMLYAPVPTITPTLIQEGFDRIYWGDFDTVFPVYQATGYIEKAMSLKNGKVSMRFPEYEFTNTQDCEPAYFPAGMFFWVNVERFLKQKSFFTANSYGIEIPYMQVSEIDTPEDWEEAELKYRMQNTT